MDAADHLAQSRHLRDVYINTDNYTENISRRRAQTLPAPLASSTPACYNIYRQRCPPRREMRYSRHWYFVSEMPGKETET